MGIRVRVACRLPLAITHTGWCIRATARSDRRVTASQKSSRIGSPLPPPKIHGVTIVLCPHGELFGETPIVFLSLWDTR